MKYKTEAKGDWCKARVQSDVTEIKMERIRLNGSDLKELAAMSDRDLCASVRQLSARVNRTKPTYYPHQRVILDALMGGKGFFSGGVVKGSGLKRGEVPIVMSTPTGRQPSGPDIQYLGTRTGRWPAANPAENNAPRAEWPKPKGGVSVDESHYFKKPSATGKSESVFVGMDFAAVERRAMAQAFTKIAMYLATEVLQETIDEEGCGPVFAALKVWKE